jgi:hypothetical protein
MARYINESSDRNTSLQELVLVPITGVLVFDQPFHAAGRQETAAGSGLYNGLVVQAQANGSADHTYGVFGQFIDTVGDTLSFTDLEREGDGGLVAVGTVRTSVNSSTGLDFYATRITRDGNRDVQSFNAPFGYEVFDFGFAGKNDTANAAAFQKDRLLIAGGSLRSANVPPDLDFTVVALQRRVIFSDGLE